MSKDAAEGGAGRRAAIALIVVSIAVGLALLMDLSPWLRGGFGWRWPYERPQLSALSRMIPGVVTLAIYGAGLRLLRRRSARWHLVWCVLGATALPVALLAWLGEPLELLYTRTISPLTTGGFSVASRMGDPAEAVRRWPEIMISVRKSASHIAVGPPGWPLLFSLAGRILERMTLGPLPALIRRLALPLRTMQCHDAELMMLSDGQLAAAWLGIAQPLWAALAALPLYAMTRRLSDEATARRAVAWWPLVPSLSLFTATLSNLYPLLSVGAVALFMRGTLAHHRVSRWPWLIAAGVVTAAGVAMSLSLVPLGLLFGLLALLSQPWREAPLRANLGRAVELGLAFGLGLGLVLAGLVASGWDLPAIYRTSMDFHLTHLYRPYWPWLALHTWDLALFLGLPLFGLTLLSLTDRRGGSLHRDGIRQIGVALVVTILAQVVSGTGRGETGRIWLFFMPLALPSAASVLGRLPRATGRAMAGVQVAWLLTLVLVLRPVGTGLTPPPILAQDAGGAETFVPVGEARFGEQLVLLGYMVEQDPAADALLLRLRWRSEGQIVAPYYFSALLVSPQGAQSAAIDWQPFDVGYPTTCWHLNAGQALVDEVSLPLEAGHPGGDWWLSLSVFALGSDDTPLRLPVRVDGILGDQMGLGPIGVVRP